MAVDLDKLMTLKGAIASGEFNEEGKIIASKGGSSEELSELMEMMSAVNSVMKQMEIKMKTIKSTPHNDLKKACVEGWAISAGGYSMCVIGNAGVFVRTEICNFKGVVRALGKEVGVI